MRGSSCGHVADLVIDALQARAGLSAVNVSREHPDDPSDIVNSTGEFDAIWVGRDGKQDVSDISIENRFVADTLVSDETYTLWLTAQSLRNDTAGSQKVATDRAVELYGEVLAAQAADPTWGFADTDEFSTFFPRGVTSEHITGRLDVGHGARFEIGLRFQCRLHLS